MPSGGNRVPQRPAAVSGPGRLSRRTDGGAGSKTQPIRVPTGGAYGEAKALSDQQRAAPLSAGEPTAPSGVPRPVGQTPQTLGGGIDVFGPTQHPNESPTRGVPQNPTTALSRNPQAALRVLYANFPNPAIQRLIDMSPYGRNAPR